MECPVCGSANVTASHRRGMEKMLRYVVPRAPYRCKDCWSRFWRLENPWKTTKAKLGALLAVLLIVGFFSLPFLGPKPSERGDSVETSEESHTLPVPTHRSAQRTYDPADRPSGSQPPETVSESVPEVESRAVDETDATEPTFAQAKPADSAASEPGTVGFSPDVTPMASAPSTADAEAPTVSEAPAGAVPPIAAGPARTDESAAPPVPADAGPDESPSADVELRPTVEATRDADMAAESSAPEPPVSESEQTTSVETAAVSPETPSPSASADELPSSPTGPRTLEALTPRSDGREFELTARAGGPVRQTHIFPLSDPPKLVIDLAGKWDRKVTSPVAAESPLVKRIRLGNHPEYLRLVLDLADAGPLGHKVTPTADGFRLRVFPEGGS